MTKRPDDTATLEEVAEAYRRARTEAERLSLLLADKARAAYMEGRRKSQILRDIGHAWTDRHLDNILKDVEPPAGTIRRTPPEARRTSK